MFTEYYWIMPIAKFVEKFGLDYPEVSYQAMEEITKRNTSEYAIRPYLVKYPDKTISKLLEWADSPNKHVRRLASEGGRPRLPWATKLDQFIDNPRPLLPILRKLNDDASKYVQKSVANCLNDILKDNPEIAKSEIESWIYELSSYRKWIIKHAIRNLRKSEDPWATIIVDQLK
jgi:3-methyladenine DNA glycosylase AlkC